MSGLHRNRVMPAPASLLPWRSVARCSEVPLDSRRKRRLCGWRPRARVSRPLSNGHRPGEAMGHPRRSATMCPAPRFLPSTRRREGMCRVWVQGVPPAQQPAPTQCAKAVRVHSPNSQVVFGPSRAGAAVSAAQPHPGVVSVGGEHVAPASAPVLHPDVSGESGRPATNAPEAAVKDRVNTGPHGSSTHGNPPPPHIPHIPARPHH